MTLVSTVTVGSGGAASIDFTSIPQTGTDLLVVFGFRSSAGVYLTFNNSASSYAYRSLRGNGATASSNSGSGASFVNLEDAAVPTSDTANTFSNCSVYVPNYTGSAAKTLSIETVGENNGTYAWQHITAASWTGTAAITSLKIDCSTLGQYSTASLYTIEKGSGGASVS